MEKAVIVYTRYRDIPWEELASAHGIREGDHPEWWERLRGQPVEIMTPGVPGEQLTTRCTELHYQVASGHPFIGEDRRTWVCSHCAEIGD